MRKFIKLIMAFAICIFVTQLALAQGCGNIQNRDKRNFCEARKSGRDARCGNIQDRDFRTYCYAVIGNRKARCGNIQDRDFRNECYSNF